MDAALAAHARQGRLTRLVLIAGTRGHEPSVLVGLVLLVGLTVVGVERLLVLPSVADDP
jgi:hypothetical protein